MPKRIIPGFFKLAKQGASLFALKFRERNSLFYWQSARITKYKGKWQHCLCSSTDSFLSVLLQFSSVQQKRLISSKLAKIQLAAPK
jgi:hypothetical protein